MTYASKISNDNLPEMTGIAGIGAAAYDYRRATEAMLIAVDGKYQECRTNALEEAAGCVNVALQGKELYQLAKRIVEVQVDRFYTWIEEEYPEGTKLHDQAIAAFSSYSSSLFGGARSLRNEVETVISGKSMEE